MIAPLLRLGCLGVAAWLAGATVAQAVLLDRQYRLGDDPAEGAAPGAPVGGSGTFDSAGVAFMQDEFVDLAPGPSAPTYATITGRPDGVGGIGLRFNGGQYVNGVRLGLPETSVTSQTPNNYDFSGVSDRGFQLWARPDSFTPGAAQTLLADTTQHGVGINADGNYAMLYAGGEFDSGVPATDNAWRHLMVVRPEGPGGGARFYVDGVAVAAAPGGYDGANTADLVLGADTGGDDGSDGGVGFTGGQSGFYSGLLDDVEMFVIGDVSGPNPDNGGTVEEFTSEFDLGDDNGFLAATLTGVAGDLNQDGLFNTLDRDAFIAGWRTENLVNGVRVGDVTTLGTGDLDFNGITDLADLVRFQSVLASSGFARISGAELAVPEPSTLAALSVLLATAAAGRRR